MIRANAEWQSVEAAAVRLEKSPGHLRRLCLAQLQAQGDARWITGGGKKGRWEVRTDFTLKHRHSSGDFEPASAHETASAMPIQIKVGAVTITIQVGNSPAVPTMARRRREAVERPSKGVRSTSE